MLKERTKFFVCFLAFSWLIASCNSKRDQLFEILPVSVSGIKFENTIVETPDLNILSYEYMYNGGGVALGDFNNDGLCDLYFSGNAVPNKLYINEGNLKFRDVTQASGTSGRQRWKTGVTAVDINADGWLDLYVCYSGPDSSFNLSNELFINNGGVSGGIPTFTESASDFGLDAPGTFSTHSAFFDYDRDGDLDMFLLNHGNHFYSPLVNTRRLRSMRHPHFGNRLYRNETISTARRAQNKFVDVSREAGIHGGGINFGLGVATSDFNGDGWVDIYVTNDYEEQDYLYLNNRDGTFEDITKRSFGHFSRNGMGTDAADFNNDGLTDLIEVDMWPSDNYRQKLLKGPDDNDRYKLMLDSGFHHQQMRNTLQMNIGTDDEGIPVFSEVGQMAGIHATDWSWSPLILDVDSDGLKDLFITNGYLRDFTSMDFLKYTVEEARLKARKENRELRLYELIAEMPSTTTRDYLFKNKGDLTFADITVESGLGALNLSFGSSYADLDNDGDLELIVNQTNAPASVWVNQSSSRPGMQYVKVALKGPPTNPFAVGSKVVVKSGDLIQFQENYLSRGYQSSVEPVLAFGLGSGNEYCSISVTWPDGKVSFKDKIKPNGLVTINYSNAQASVSNGAKKGRIFCDVTGESGIDFVHQENLFDDFDREPLLPYMFSREGPALAAGDVDSNGLDDFFVGGAFGQSGSLFIQVSDGIFSQSAGPWDEDSQYEDTSAIFFDADSDSDLDLFVVSGGNEFPSGSIELDDRLYLNEGRGNFRRAPDGSIVADHANGSCVAAADYDNDGDVDLFVGGRVVPGAFPTSAAGAILRNETNGNPSHVKFVVATNQVNPELRQAGLVTDAVWTDYNSDGWMDLVLVGEWMAPRFFENSGGKLIESDSSKMENENGLWRSVLPVDFDSDGDQDFVLGNAGTNLPWKTSTAEPMVLFSGDFDGDGIKDPILSAYNNGYSYPIASRDELLAELAPLRKRFVTYSSFGRATIEEMLPKTIVSSSDRLKVETLKSSLFENIGRGRFRAISLPQSVQVSSAETMLFRDFNKDGAKDLLLAGNFFPYRTQFGPSDASRGVLIEFNKGAFNSNGFSDTGFNATGDVRKMVEIKGNSFTYVLVARNNGSLSLFKVGCFD